MIEGLDRAHAQERSFAWAPVLRFCRMLRPIGLDDGEFRRRQLDIKRVMLIERGLYRGPGEIPLDQREHVWACIQQVLDRSHPVEANGIDQGGDAYAAAINELRPRAVQAVVAYALWAFRQLGLTPDSRSMGMLPEVRQTLEEQLKARCTSIRAVFGRWLPHLAYIDRGWTQIQLPTILPDAPIDEALRDAAWAAYLRYAGATDLLLLKAGYVTAVENMSATAGVGEPGEDLASTLAEHMMLFYWNGEFETDAMLLERFYARAPDAARARADAWIGWQLVRVEGEEEIRQPVSQRLEKLWRDRLDAGESAPGREEYVRELAEFAPWFASGFLEDQRALALFRRTLDLNPRVKERAGIMERLARAALATPIDALKCLDRLSEVDNPCWLLRVYPQRVQEVLRAAQASTEPDVQSEARRVRNVLAFRGYGDLLA